MTEERTIVFTGMTGRIDVPSFVLTENSDLRIKLDFAGMKSKSGLFRMFVRHGGAPEYTFAFTQKEPYITLPAQWLNRGGTEYLEFSLKQYNDAGTMLINGGYMIEPLNVRSEDGNYTVTSVIQELIEKTETLKEEVEEAIEEHKSSVAGDLAGVRERVAESLSAFQEDIEGFKSNVSGTVEQAKAEEKEAREKLEGETASRLAGMDEKLERVTATLDKVLSKMQEYVDNGAEVTFRE